MQLKQFFIEENYDWDEKFFPDRDTYLETTWSFGELSRLEECLRFSSRINSQVEFRDKGLMFAAIFGKLDVLKHLICEVGCSINTRNKRGESIMHLAAKNEQMQILQWILNQENELPKDSEGVTPLHWAARLGNIEVFQEILNHFPEEINPSCNYGITPLAWGCINGHFKFVEYLLEKLCKANQRFLPIEPSGISPLHHCALHGHLEIYKMIVEKFSLSEINPKDKAGYTPMHMATQTGEFEFVKHIFSLVKEKNPLSSYGNSVCHEAARFGETRILK